MSRRRASMGPIVIECPDCRREYPAGHGHTCPRVERFYRWNVGKRLYDVIEGRVVDTVREKPDD